MKILIAEDERDIVLVYRIVLEERNHDLVVTDNGKDCLTIYRQELKNFISRGRSTNNKGHPFDIVILDYKMPGINGMEVAKEILEMNPKQKIIIASAYPEETFSPSLRQLGQLVEIMRKPFHIDTLIDMIEKKEFYSKLQKLNKDTDIIQKFNLT